MPSPIVITPEKKSGVVYTSKNCGDFVIVKYHTTHKVDIKFLLTGYSPTVSWVQVSRKSVGDPYYPSVYGVGFLGVGKYKCKLPTSRKKTASYIKWHSMMQRCYDSKLHKYRPTYKDCTVCEEWHNYQNFAKWFEINHIDGYVLDKDKLQPNVLCKIYSPTTCVFITEEENTNIRNSDDY